LCSSAATGLLVPLSPDCYRGSTLAHGKQLEFRRRESAAPSLDAITSARAFSCGGDGNPTAVTKHPGSRKQAQSPRKASARKWRPGKFRRSAARGYIPCPRPGKIGRASCRERV